MNHSKEFDIIIWGSSGFTGRLVASYFYNKYGSDGAAGVIIVKTSVSASNNELINSPRNLWRTVTEKRIRIKKN